MPIRKVKITNECKAYIESQPSNVAKKFLHIFHIITTQKVISEQFVKKIVNTDFYELRIITRDHHRIITFAVDNDNFMEATKIICLNGFLKKSKKDYKPAINKADSLLSEYKKMQNEQDENL